MVKRAEQQKEHLNILNLIERIRNSFDDATTIYTNGACYGLYRILNAVWCHGTAYITPEGRHIVTKIYSRYYDIFGEFTNNMLEVDNKGLKELTKEEHEIRSSVHRGQRVEYMIKKKYG